MPLGNDSPNSMVLSSLQSPAFALYTITFPSFPPVISFPFSWHKAVTSFSCPFTCFSKVPP